MSKEKDKKGGHGHNFVKIVLAALGYTIVAQAIHTVGAFLTMGYYQDVNYSEVWSSFMMKNSAAPGMEFYILSITFAFVSGLIFASIYSVLKDKLPGEGLLQKGFVYGFIAFFLAGVSTNLTIALLINLPFSLVFYWTIEALVLYLVAGALVAAIVKDKK